MECPKDIFDKFLKAVPVGYADDKECLEFAYNALCVDEEFLFDNRYQIIFPPITDEILEDWFKLEDWLCDFYPDLYMGIDGLCSPTFDWAEDDAPPPNTLIASPEALKQLVLEKLDLEKHDEFLCSNQAAVVRIKSNGRNLELIYTDFAAWGLGHADSVIVTDDPNYLREENNWYEIR